jgi:hypothetical protein
MEAGTTSGRGEGAATTWTPSALSTARCWQLAILPVARAARSGDGRETP